MQKLTSRPRISRAAVIVPLSAKLPQLYTARCAMISSMSGYPSAHHSIGRLQRSIKLDSMKELLESIKRLYHLAYVTAEVIESMDGTKVDRYQLNRTEIIAYVTNVTANLRSFTASEEDVDLIAQLITSFEANPAAWILQGGYGDDDLHLQFQRLYKEVLVTADGIDLYTYSPHNDTVTKLGDLPQFDMLTKKHAKKKKEEGVDDTVDKEPAQALFTQYRLASVRLIDHVYQLMLDKDVWYQFVIPRTKADVMTNLERAKGLKVLALYCQSLLTYHQFFLLEMFMKSYDLVQDWIAHFPKLEEHTLRTLDATIRPHDFLDAKGDVQKLLDSFSSAAQEDIGALVFPEEFLTKYGLTQKIRELTSRAGDFSLAADLSNIKELDDARYLPLISGVSAATLDVAYSLAQTLLIGKLVSKEIDNALTGLIPSMTRGSARSSIEGLRALGIRCTVPFEIPHAASWQITSGAEKGIISGRLQLDSASPTFSYDYHKFVREQLRFMLVTDRQIPSRYTEFLQPQVADHDKARVLRDVLGYNWRTLVPSTWRNSDRLFRMESFRNQPDSVRSLLETMSGMNYEIAIRELSLQHLREVWATYCSSFALMYVKTGDNAPLSKVAENITGDPTLMTLVLGHGRPYGTTYNALEAMQGTLNQETPLVAIGNGIYLRFLTDIPIVTDDLKLDEQPFYAEHPYMYFASNSGSMKVTGWVFDEGLTNFTLIPTSHRQAVPEVKFTPKYAFLTQSLFLNMDVNFSPTQPSKARETMDVAVVTSDWPFDRHQYFLEYKHFGKYSSPAGEIKVADETPLIADAIEKIEKAIKEDTDEAATASQDAGKAVAEASKKADAEVEQAQKDASGQHIQDDENPLTV